MRHYVNGGPVSRRITDLDQKTWKCPLVPFFWKEVGKLVLVISLGYD